MENRIHGSKSTRGKKSELKNVGKNYLESNSESEFADLDYRFSHLLQHSVRIHRFSPGTRSRSDLRTDSGSGVN